MVVQPNNQSQPQPNKKLKIPIIIGAVICIILLVVLIVVLVANSNTTEDADEEDDVYAALRQDTPTLQIYSRLQEEMTVEELETIAKQIAPSAEIALYSNGTGELTIPDQPDAIIFDHNLSNVDQGDEDVEIDDETEVVEDDKGLVDDSDEMSIDIDDITSPIQFLPTDTIFNIRYSYVVGDGGFVIDYSEEDAMYEMFDMNSVRQFDTKMAAVGTYLDTSNLEDEEESNE